MDQKDIIYTLKLIGIQYYHSNHSNGTQPNRDCKVFKNHQVSDHILTLLLYLWYMVDLLFVQFIFIQRLFVQKCSSNPNLTYPNLT